MNNYFNEIAPKDNSILNAYDLYFREGYTYIQNRTISFNSDLFEADFLGTKVICISGEEAARLFYDNSKFYRHGVAPSRIEKTLIGEGAIHTLDDIEHAHRKSMFSAILNSSNVNTLLLNIQAAWQSKIAEWECKQKIILYKEVRELLCQTVCKWAGINIQEEEIESKAKDFIQMVEAFGAIGPRHWKGRVARVRTEDWISQIITNARANITDIREGSALQIVANFTDTNGMPLDLQTATVDLINAIRPIIAVSMYITFSALALHEFPIFKDKLIGSNDKELEYFAQEVRRFYPFAPFLGAKVKDNFKWNGYEFKQDYLVLLDIYGTNHDFRIWEDPYIFNPERFRNWDGNQYNFIPQGGGSTESGHRCPGEMLTIELMKIAIDNLVNNISYDIPFQDLSYSIATIPSQPVSGFIMSNVRRVFSN